MGLRLYTVHGPAGAGRAVDPARAEFVPDGFSWAAFVAAPIWLGWNGAWAGLAPWAGARALLFAAERAFDLGGPAMGIAELALMYAFGLFAYDLKRWQLALSGRPVAGVVAAEGEEAALLRFAEGRAQGWAEGRPEGRAEGLA